MLKYFYRAIFTFSCLSMLLACDQSQKEETSTTTPTDTTNVYLQTIRPVDEFSNKFQTLIKSDSGIVRGVYFSTSLAEVMKMEETNTFEKEGNTLALEVDLDSTELADVTYQFNQNDIVEQIKMELYLKDDQSLNKLSSEFTDYFSAKYGTVKQQEPGKLEWTLPNSRKINMQVIKKDIDRGILIQIQ